MVKSYADNFEPNELTGALFRVLPMVPLTTLPLVSLVAVGTIGNQKTLNVFRQPILPLNLPKAALVEPFVPMVPFIGPMALMKSKR